jgi:ATP-dependent helicase/nuclease subunit A
MPNGPNAEQLIAIEHNGGVLLKAGAGSGKTYVLVEHILYLATKWISEFKAAPQGNFDDFIRQKFSQVVMMTFTKKAAGEMSIRLTDRVLEVSRDTQVDKDLWEIVNESLPMLMVTTIDGFCKKLIASGYFPHLSTETKVIFNPERTDQVRSMVDEWFKDRGHSLMPEVMDIFIREKKQLLSAFTNVFNDPGLRLAWKKFRIQEIHPSTIGKILSQSFELNDLSSALAGIHALDLPVESERSAFEKNVAKFQASGLPVVDSVENFNIYATLFEPIKSLQPERTESKKDPAHTKAHEGLSQLKEWIVKTWKKVIVEYKNHYEEKVLPWMNLCLELYHFIEERLDPNQGMTFGDIEYHVALGLENQENRERIQKVFRYFIVDEFQDTSSLQFRIIQGLIDSDYKRLFCVGDAKQAIYGFRGGELSVFQDCAELIPNVRSLANNYRSLPAIIQCNNSLFRTILPLGQEFEGHDPFTVSSEDQNIPAEVERKEGGSIEILTAKLELDVEVKKDFSTSDINRMEALLIAESIKREREQKPDDVCTVLYQRLKPSGELIRALMERRIGFTAQFKIDLLDDPLLGIFLCLLKRRFDTNEKTRDKSPLFLIESYLSVLGVASKVSVEDLKNFDSDIEYWGLIEAFRKFLHKLSITNENSDVNLGTIESISALYHQDPESIMVQLSRGENDRLSLDLRSGENSHMVQIMSAHASKGLEFDTVYVGGIFTNGKDKGESSLFGNLPGSFRWHLDVSQKETQNSPLYVFESELAKYKNFSESKRLFYVTCTRAKKKLVWVDFDIQEKTFRPPKNSWIRGFRAWIDRGLDQDNIKVIAHDDFNAQEILNSQSLPELPLFFHDPMGIFDKGLGKSELMLAPELSVTRLNSLLDCPRKYYLANVLKLTATSEAIPYLEETEEVTLIKPSSSERGTLIHAQIAKGIAGNFIAPREVFGTENQASVEWALNLLKDLPPDFEMVPEKSLKFKFFNFMISGIPDLVLLPKGKHNAQVWDYKTGRITQENLEHYWVQLTVYAYALYELKKIPLESEVELVLGFVDEQKLLKQTVTRSICKEKLYPIWVSQNEPWKTNLDHCTQCSYGDICPR